MNLQKRNTKLVRIRKKRKAFQRRRRECVQKSLLSCKSNENNIHKDTVFCRGQAYSQPTKPFIYDYDITQDYVDVLLEDYEIIEYNRVNKIL